MGQSLIDKTSKSKTLDFVNAYLTPIVKKVSSLGLAVLARLQSVGGDQNIRWTRQFPARLIRVLVLAGMSFPVNQIPVRASALTYTSILSFVPFAVILSAVAGHFGYLDLLSRLIFSLVDSMNLDLNLDPILSVIDYAQKLDFHKLGLVGSLGLLFTFFLSMSNIELAMDHIWDIRKKRNWWRRIREFTPFLVLLIVLVIAAGNVILKYRSMLDAKFSHSPLPGFMHSTIFFLSTVCIVGFVWLGMVLLFYIIPNTRVRKFPAMLAASISTAAIFGLTRALILFPSLFLSRNNFIYGSLAIFPVVLLMIYLFWTIVLYGAAVGFVYQRLYRDENGKEAATERVNAFHHMEKEVFALLRAVHTLSDSKGSEKLEPVSLKRLAADLWDDEASTEALADPLVEMDLLAKLRVGEEWMYTPLRPLAEVDLTALHYLLLRIDPNGSGKLRVLTPWDDLNHTLGILYSSGKRHPPLFMEAVLPGTKVSE